MGIICIKTKYNSSRNILRNFCFDAKSENSFDVVKWYIHIHSKYSPSKTILIGCGISKYSSSRNILNNFIMAIAII